MTLLQYAAGLIMQTLLHDFEQAVAQYTDANHAVLFPSLCRAMLPAAMRNS
jgi:hypothetical protein